MSIVVCGESLIDFVPQPVCENGKADTVFLPVPGGSPFNAAIAMGRLEVPVAFMGKVANDFFGEAILAALACSGVGTGSISRTDAHTTLAFVDNSIPDSPRFAFYNVRTAHTLLETGDLDLDLLDRADAFVFGSIALLDRPTADTIEAALERLPPRTVVCIDPNIRPGLVADRTEYAARLERCFSRADIIKLSQEDLAWLYPGRTNEEAARALLGKGAVLVVLTLGANGSAAWTATESCRVESVRVKLVDTIGAGDTFHGALVARLWRDGKLTRTAISALSAAELRGLMEFAARCAGITCSRRGADPPRTAELRDSSLPS